MSKQSYCLFWTWELLWYLLATFTYAIENYQQCSPCCVSIPVWLNCRSSLWLPLYIYTFIPFYNQQSPKSSSFTTTILFPNSISLIFLLIILHWVRLFGVAFLWHVTKCDSPGHLSFVSQMESTFCYISGHVVLYLDYCK